MRETSAGSSTIFATVGVVSASTEARASSNAVIRSALRTRLLAFNNYKPSSISRSVETGMYEFQPMEGVPCVGKELSKASREATIRHNDITAVLQNAARGADGLPRGA